MKQVKIKNESEYDLIVEHYMEKGNRLVLNITSKLKDTTPIVDLEN